MKIELPNRIFRAHIYDLDGTLADSMPVHLESFQEVFRKHGASFEFTWELFHEVAGASHFETVAYLNKKFGDQLDPHAINDEKQAAYVARLAEVQPIEAVIEHVHTARAKGLKQAVASGGPKAQVMETLNGLGIADLFDAIVGVDEVERGKPSPDLFLEAAHRIGVDPSECLVFEDALNGIRAAETAGMAWVRVPDPRTGKFPEA